MNTTITSIITWLNDGEASLLRVDSLRITVRSTKAFPPGAPAHGTLCTDPPRDFTLKISSSRRDGDHYIVEGRLISATVSLREAFSALGAIKPQP